MRAPILDARVKIKRWDDALPGVWDKYSALTAGQGQVEAHKILDSNMHRSVIQQCKLDVFINKKYVERQKITRRLIEENMYRPVLQHFLRKGLIPTAATKLHKVELHTFLKDQKEHNQSIRLTGTKADLFKQVVSIVFPSTAPQSRNKPTCTATTPTIRHS